MRATSEYSTHFRRILGKCHARWLVQKTLRPRIRCRVRRGDIEDLGVESDAARGERGGGEARLGNTPSRDLSEHKSRLHKPRFTSAFTQMIIRPPACREALTAENKLYNATGAHATGDQH